MSFYNPFMKGPDFGQGMSDLANQLMTMFMLKKYMPQGSTQPQVPTAVPPKNPMGANAILGGQGARNLADRQYGLSPEIINYILSTYFRQ